MQNLSIMNLTNIQEKRAHLKAISAPIKLLLKQGAVHTINEGLAVYYAQQGHFDLNTFKGWIDQGFKVKKGEKALLLWGQPKAIASKKENKEGEEQDYFPVAHVFSASQIEPLSK